MAATTTSEPRTAGHTQVLALFDRSGIPHYRGPEAATSTIDHIAFEIACYDATV